MFKIPIDIVVPGIVLDHDIYGDKNKNLPLLAKGTRVTADFLYKLKKRGVSHVYASNQASLGNKSFMQDSPRERNPLSGMNIPFQKSRSVIAPKTKDEIMKTMKDFQISLSGLDANDVCKIVNSLDAILNTVLGGFPKNLTKPINVQLLQGDDLYSYIYRHALSVAVISMAIGQYLSLPPDDVLQLGKCASMHDIGMFLIPMDILQKPAAFKKDEIEIVKRHSMLGYRSLVKMEVADETISNGILHHHERLDGSGYPLGLTGDNIPLWSRIVAVADVYDAMTSPRPHRVALTPAETCEFIMGSANSAFEYDIVAALLRRIEFYPVGICVKLSSGDNAVVMENTRNQLRPVVRVLQTDSAIDLNDRKYLDITILRAVSYQDIVGRR